jgi:tetratricopeptide (TPR) repeat protein
LAGLLGVVPAAWLAAPTSARTRSFAPAPAPHKHDPRQIAKLIEQGTNALTVGEATAARDAFSDAVQADPRNPVAWQGLAMAYYGLKDYTKAGSAIDRAITYAGKKVDHAMAFNAGVIQLHNNPMRAAKLAREYLAAHPNPPDEPVANVIGYALQNAEPRARKTAFYADTQAFYARYLQHLENSNPGYLRWGAQWLPVDDVKAKRKANAAIQPQVDALAKDLTEMDSQLAVGKRKLAVAEAQAARFTIDQSIPDRMRDQIQELEDKGKDKKKQYDDLVAQLSVPQPLPELNRIVAMNMPVPQ